MLLYPKSRGRAPVFGEKGGRSDIKKSRTVKRMRTHLDRLAAKVSAVARGIAPHEGGRGEGRSAATLVRPRPQRQRIRSRPTKRRGRKKNRSTAGLPISQTQTKNQFGKEPEGLRQFRDHRWKALGEENSDLSGLFLFRQYFESYIE